MKYFLKNIKSYSIKDILNKILEKLNGLFFRLILIGFVITPITKLLILVDKIIRKIFKNNYFLPLIHDRIEAKQYYSTKILNKKITFFCPSARSLKRFESLLTKEPETIKWMDNFKTYNSKRIVFWDIGANIGLYSIYAAIKFQDQDIKIFSFEPSPSNTRSLSRNISINNLYDKINIFPLALSEKENIISFFNETIFSEGGSFSSFNNNIDHIGNFIETSNIQNKFNIFGTTIDKLISDKIIEIPNYIKIDVDGIEHLIVRGAQNLLKNDELQGLLIEMNPDYQEQYEFINKIMEDNNFKKTTSTNARLTKEKWSKRFTNENINVIFKKNI